MKKAVWWQWGSLLLCCLSLLSLLAACSLDKKGDSTRWLILATSQEVGDSGLLDAIIPPFEQANNVRVKRLVVSTQQAIRYARDGGVDVLLISGGKIMDELAGQAPVIPLYTDKPPPTPTPLAVPTLTPTAQLPDFLFSERKLIFWSQIVLVGPPDDPIGADKTSTALKAMQAILQPNSKTSLIVAAQEPGLRAVEENLWRLVGLEKVEARGTNYQLFNGDAIATLRQAEDKNAYTLVPLSTFLSYARPGKSKIVYDRDISLFVPYEASIPNVTRFRDRDLPLQRQFLSYLTNTEAQNTISEQGKIKYNRLLFRPQSFLVYIPK